MRVRILPTAATFALATSCLALGCTSAQTAVSAPSGTKCEISVNNSPSSFTASGGAGTVSVGAPRDCTWAVTTDTSWVSIGGARNGQGDASVPYTVAANPVPAPRSGSLVVASQSVQLSQAAAPCQFSLSRSGDSIGASGGRLTVDVTTLTGCTWNATAGDSWIAIASGQSGNANGIVAMSIAANSGARRVGHATIASQTYTVTQDAAPAPPPPAPAPPAPSPPPSPPAPSPSPTPAPPQNVHVDGRVQGVIGRCPNVLFGVGGTPVVADGSTTFKNGNCGDLEDGVQVAVEGVRQGTGVKANSVEISKKKDDDH